MPLIDNWHIDVVADHLDRVVRGEITRLIMNLPPRSLKSQLASLALPVWIFGHNPESRIMSVTGSMDLRRDFDAAVMQLLSSWRFRAVFPHLGPGKPSGDIKLEHGGALMRSIVGRTMVGRGADVIFIDDPIAPAHVHAAPRRSLVNTWFDAEVLQRLNDKAKGAVIIVMQRLHHDNLCGHLLRGAQPWCI